MGRDLGTLDEYLGKYEAYAEPETGGFNVLPQSAVPDVGMDEETRRRLLGDEQTPLPHAYIGLSKFPDAAAPAAAPAKKGDLGTLDEFMAGTRAASTVVPKGGTPFQPSVLQDQALETYRRLLEPPRRNVKPLSATETGTASAIQTYADNLLATPSLAADLATYPVRRIGNAVMGKEQAPWFGATPRATVGKIGAAAASLTEPDLTYDQALQKYKEAEAARIAEHPLAAATGDVIGDVATIATGRLPLRPAIKRTAIAAEKKLAEAEAKAAASGGHKVYTTEREALASVGTSPGWLKFKRGLGRAGEAGVEGAVLGLLHEGDPVKTAAYSAGAQGVLSGTTAALTTKLIPKLGGVGRIGNFAINMMVLSSAIYGLKVALPGEIKDYEAQKDAARKAVIGTILGGITGLASTRDRTGRLSALAPDLMEVASSAPRNAMQSYITRWLGSDTSTRESLQTKLNHVIENFDSLTEPQQRDLSAAFERGQDAFMNQLDKITGGKQ